MLLRRAYFDLIGLPPPAEKVEAFLADDRPDAFPRIVDELLASPHYGERWGAHWLDAVRYADSDGFEKDKPREVWSYRDWVINALNRDLPYNEFVIEQIAGDLLPGSTVADRRRQRAAINRQRTRKDHPRTGAERAARVEHRARPVEVDPVAKVGVGLGLVLLVYRNRRSISLDELSKMKG